MSHKGSTPTSKARSPQGDFGAVFGRAVEAQNRPTSQLAGHAASAENSRGASPMSKPKKSKKGKKLTAPGNKEEQALAMPATGGNVKSKSQDPWAWRRKARYASIRRTLVVLPQILFALYSSALFGLAMYEMCQLNYTSKVDPYTWMVLLGAHFAVAAVWTFFAFYLEWQTEPLGTRAKSQKWPRARINWFRSAVSGGASVVAFVFFSYVHNNTAGYSIINLHLRTSLALALVTMAGSCVMLDVFDGLFCCMAEWLHTHCSLSAWRAKKTMNSEPEEEEEEEAAEDTEVEETVTPVAAATGNHTKPKKSTSVAISADDVGSVSDSDGSGSDSV
jgi:hypothetical protein